MNIQDYMAECVQDSELELLFDCLAQAQEQDEFEQAQDCADSWTE